MSDSEGDSVILRPRRRVQRAAVVSSDSDDDEDEFNSPPKLCSTRIHSLGGNYSDGRNELDDSSCDLVEKSGDYGNYREVDSSSSEDHVTVDDSEEEEDTGPVLEGSTLPAGEEPEASGGHEIASIESPPDYFNAHPSVSIRKTSPGGTSRGRSSPPESPEPSVTAVPSPDPAAKGRSPTEATRVPSPAVATRVPSPAGATRVPSPAGAVKNFPAKSPSEPALLGGPSGEARLSSASRDKKLAALKEELAQVKRAARSIPNLDSLPDKGAKLRSKYESLKGKIRALQEMDCEEPDPERVRKEKTAELHRLRMQHRVMNPAELAENGRKLQRAISALEQELAQMDLASTASSSQASGYTPVVQTAGAQAAPRPANLAALYAANPHLNQLYGGRMTENRRIEVRSVTMDALKQIHGALKVLPGETIQAVTPPGITVSLMPHQRHALAWMQWRETQHPPGGILADEMGLGKTLSMLALVLAQKGCPRPEVEGLKTCGTTLVICPASLISQWESEAETKIGRRLRVLVYHGSSRGKHQEKLDTYDLVITTYTLVMKECNVTPPTNLFRLGWDRIILDEGHTIRNPKAQTSQAVCSLRAGRRWVVTGTPLHNREMDIYSLLRFLRCSPFDELAVWKNWVDNKSAAGVQRLNLVIKCLMLRRTKDQDFCGQRLVVLPSKEVQVHSVEMNEQEREVYEKVLSFSQKMMMDFLKQQADRDADMAKLGTGAYGGHKMKGLEQGEAVKAHHLLVLLLRLRQICCHPGLIKSMLDSESRHAEAIAGDDPEADLDVDLLSQLETMSLGDGDKASRDSLILHVSNPVFDISRASSKIKLASKELSKIKSKALTGHREKVVVVSQWTSFLSILQEHLQVLGFRCVSLTGQVPVNKRGEIVEAFNDPRSDIDVMLLSLVAGGVGLNLMGGNHLFMMDLHWNPQLEAQACDRVHRMGQTKDVHVHRFVTGKSVEERIVELQEKKLNLASMVLAGAKRKGLAKLTLEDMKHLFGLSEVPAVRPVLKV